MGAFQREHFLHDLDQLRSPGKASGPDLALLEDHAGEPALGVSLNQHEQADLHVSSFRPVTRGRRDGGRMSFRRILLSP